MSIKKITICDGCGKELRKNITDLSFIS